MSVKKFLQCFPTAPIDSVLTFGGITCWDENASKPDKTERKKI